MAYTSSPQFQTYSTKSIKFDGTATQRLGGGVARNRDIDIVNMYYDRVSQENKQREVWLKKRPGLAATNYDIGRTGANKIRGYYYHRESNRLYYAIGTKVRSFNFNSGTTFREVQTLTTSSGHVGFCDFLKSDGTKYIVFTDGVELFVDTYATSTCTKVTDADLPTPHLPFPVYLDGYIFLAKPDTNDFYNSTVDDPFSWVAGDFLQAEMSADSIVRIAKNRNYLIVFGKESLEMFYNAAIATGSPMQRNDSAFKNIGYISGLCSYGDKLYFVGQEKEANVAIYEIDGFKVNKISNEVIDRSIQADAPANVTDFSTVTLTVVNGLVSVDGHTFYMVRAERDTWMYDVEEKFWYRWRKRGGDPLDIEASFTLYNGQCICILEDQATLSLMSPLIYQDFDQNFLCSYTTEDFTGETYNWKTCHRAMLIGDMWDNTGTSNVLLEWSDDDWKNTTGSGNINVFSSSPYITRLGRFRNRSFRLSYSEPYPLRIKQLDLDLNIGAT
jgi:hypothetical protein